eukprot:9401506-Alexandrium_andersonii.AAC.1
MSCSSQGLQAASRRSPELAPPGLVHALVGSEHPRVSCFSQQVLVPPIGILPSASRRPASPTRRPRAWAQAARGCGSSGPGCATRGIP